MSNSSAQLSTTSVLVPSCNMDTALMLCRQCQEESVIGLGVHGAKTEAAFACMVASGLKSYGATVVSRWG